MDSFRTTLAFVACLLLSGCIGFHPSKGEYKPGFSVDEIFEGRYRVRYNGPGSTREHLLRANIERRAAELCPSGYVLSEFVYDEISVMHGDPPHFNFATALVVCD